MTSDQVRNSFNLFLSKIYAPKKHASAKSKTPPTLPRIINNLRVFIDFIVKEELEETSFQSWSNKYNYLASLRFY